MTDDQLARGFANIPRNVIEQLGLDRMTNATLPDRHKNFNASLGGPIVKDKVW